MTEMERRAALKVCMVTYQTSRPCDSEPCQRCLAQVRSVLREIREPTQEMLDRMGEITRAQWSNVIDAALSEVLRDNLARRA